MSDRQKNSEYLENLKALIAKEDENLSYIDRLIAKAGKQQEG